MVNRRDDDASVLGSGLVVVAREHHRVHEGFDALVRLAAVSKREVDALRRAKQRSDRDGAIVPVVL